MKMGCGGVELGVDRGLENIQENSLISCSSFWNSFQTSSCLVTFPVACVGPLVFLWVVRFWIVIKFGVLKLLHVLTNFTDVLLIYKARLCLPLLMTAW